MGQEKIINFEVNAKYQKRDEIQARAQTKIQTRFWWKNGTQNIPGSQNRVDSDEKPISDAEGRSFIGYKSYRMLLVA